MAANSRNYDLLTNDQMAVLKDFYDKEMNTKEKNMREVILKATEQAETSYKKVKVKRKVWCNVTFFPCIDK